MNTQSTTALSVSEIETGILLLTLDMPDSGANILSQTMFDELDATMAELALRQDIQGLILFSEKPSIFVAGADLKAIVKSLDWSDREIVHFCERGRAVMARFSRCPFVTVAAIHGACVGGGLELTLWCDCRIASDDRKTVLGLPEVKLGLIPGWAGTVRLPRLAGFEHAADMVTSGRLVSAAEAQRMGFVDEVVKPDDLVGAATRMIRRVKMSESFIRDRKAIMGAVPDLNQLQHKTREIGERIVENQNVFPYAPTVALEHMSRTAPVPQQEAWASESIAMSQVWGSPASRGLLNHFFLVDRNKKHPGLVDLSLKPARIQTVGIVGAGLMGRSIAESCLRRGVSVILLDANHSLAELVATELSATTPGPAIRSTESYEGFAKVDLAIESVVETFDVKKIVLQNIEKAVSAETIIASNTSAIPIGRLAEIGMRPENFCGIHFCHPELMSLVEVICGPHTSEQTVATAVGWVRSLGKMAVAMNDGAGFVVNRLLAAMLDQAFRILTKSGVSIEQIDQAMRDFGFRGGPFEIIDVIGADTCMYAGRTMWECGLRCVTLSPIPPKMMKTGRLGRKSGVGFYRYPEDGGQRQWDNELDAVLKSYIDQSPESLAAGRRLSQNPERIPTQILSAMVLEATHILEEQMVADFRDIDLCVIHGFSFPQHRGGIFFWADQVGLTTVNQTLFEMAESESRLAPSEMLLKMRQQGKRFYPQ